MKILFPFVFRFDLFSELRKKLYEKAFEDILKFNFFCKKFDQKIKKQIIFKERVWRNLWKIEFKFILLLIANKLFFFF